MLVEIGLDYMRSLVRDLEGLCQTQYGGILGLVSSARASDGRIGRGVSFAARSSQKSQKKEVRRLRLPTPTPQPKLILC